jgi:hypothetical protein
MAEVIAPTSSEARRAKVRLPLWDRMMRFSDVGIATFSVIIYAYLFRSWC